MLVVNNFLSYCGINVEATRNFNGRLIKRLKVHDEIC